MQRLYKFFLLLFIVLFALSYLYELVMIWSMYGLFAGQAKAGVIITDIPFSVYLKASVWPALVYSLVVTTSLIFLSRLSFMTQKRFTIGEMLNYTGLFFLLTTLVFVLYFLWVLLFIGFDRFLVITFAFTFPGPFWFPFPIAWISLYIFFTSKIKNKPAYGRED